MLDWTMINSEKQEINVKRVSCKKRSRDGLRTYLTPSRKRQSDLGPQGPPGGTGQAEQGPPGGTGQGGQGPPGGPGSTEHATTFTEYCSDSEDLFGDYNDDSLLGNSSLMAKLDRAGDVEGPPHSTDDLGPPPHSTDAQGPPPHSTDDLALSPPPHFTALRSSDASPTPPYDEELSESLLAGFGDSFRDVPATQRDFQEEVVRHRDIAGDKTSTPCRAPEGTTSSSSSEPSRRRSERPPKARRSMAALLKTTLLGNAQGPAHPSRSSALKEAELSEEMGVAARAMEALSTETPDLGPFYGLPSRVKDLVFTLKGITDLYEWQKTCLNLRCVQDRRNLIYSLPTSGGKTLVAEILILKEMICRKKDCVFILPYVSLVQEKVRGLATLGLELDFLVEEYAGSKGRFPPVKRRQRRCLYVCTIEKGHSLVNSLIETSRLDDVGLVVVDELHMLGDGSRGAIIEMTLAKVLYVSKSTQIIGMSATLGNVKDLQTFLRAENFDNDFRPVQLQEFVKLKDSIYEVDPREEDGIRLSRFLNFKYSSNMQKADPDHIVALVTEVIPAHSCLIFCPTKKNCENVALMICKYLTEAFVLRKKEEKGVLLGALKASGNGSLCPVLRRTVPYGLAYHHSGLTTEERRLVEEAYSDGTLCLLACTSTLAAGINLPARRVILRSPYVAADFLKRSQYKQMVGRAGRAGIDTMGESILILQEKDRNMAKNLLVAPMEKCFSNLMHDDGKGLLSLILSLIGLKISVSVDQLQSFLSGTLLSVQQGAVCVERSLQEEADQALQLLKDRGLVVSVVSSSASEILQVTRLGRAAFKGSVDLSYCELLYKDLSKGLEGLLLDSFLHLLYLVTPYDMVSHCKPDWMLYLRQFTKLSASEQRMCAAVGVPESLITRKAAGQTTKKSANMEVVHRLYLALVLFSLLNDTDVWSVAERFQLSRGFLQTLLSSSSAFCSCVFHFTEELEELWPYKALLTELTRRLTYCVQADLIPLMEVNGVMESRAKQLYNAGFKTLSHLANADPGFLASSVENLYKKQAQQIVASAKMLLSEKAAALQEEMDDLLMIPADEAVP